MNNHVIYNYIYLEKNNMKISRRRNILYLISIILYENNNNNENMEE